MKTFRQQVPLLLLLLALPAMAQTAAKTTPATVPEMPFATTVGIEGITVTAISIPNATLQFGTGSTWCPTTFTGPKVPFLVSYSTPANTTLCAFDPAPGTVKTLAVQQQQQAFTVSYTLAGKTTVVNVPAFPPITPAIVWPPPPPVPAGTALTSVELNASTTTTPGTFTYSPPLGAVMTPAGTVSLTTVFTPTDTVHYTTSKAAVPLVVTKTVVATFPAICTQYSDTTFSCTQNGPMAVHP